LKEYVLGNSQSRRASATTTGAAAGKRHTQYGSRKAVHYKSTLMMDKDISEMGIKQYFLDFPMEIVD
jgi:hypothetical protein